MKAIGVDQPWADLVLRGLVDVVKLPFAGEHRGRTLLCACDERIAWETAAFYLEPNRFEEMGVIGAVDVVDVVRSHPSPWSYPDDKGYVWVLEKAKRLPFRKHRVRKTSVFDVEGIDINVDALGPRLNERNPIHPRIVADPICALAVLLEVDSLRDIAESVEGVELPAGELAARRAFVTNLRNRAGHAIVRLSHGELVQVMEACAADPTNLSDRELREELGEICWGGLPRQEPTFPYRPREVDTGFVVALDDDDDDWDDEDDADEDEDD